jgi:hypothetical protein
VLALAAGRCAAPAGLLHGMSRIEHHGTLRRAQDRERAHVDDEIVVAERDTALTDEQSVITRGARLVDDVRHFPGGKKLPLF